MHVSAKKRNRIVLGLHRLARTGLSVHRSSKTEQKHPRCVTAPGFCIQLTSGSTFSTAIRYLSAHINQRHEGLDIEYDSGTENRPRNFPKYSQYGHEQSFFTSPSISPAQPCTSKFSARIFKTPLNVGTLIPRYSNRCRRTQRT